jgi:hypothetical protein
MISGFNEGFSSFGNSVKSGVSSAATGAFQAVHKTVSTLTGQVVCSQCEANSDVQCVCCERWFCRKHQVLDEVRGIIRNKSANVCIPDHLKAETFRSTHFAKEAVPNGPIEIAITCLSDTGNTAFSFTKLNEFACCYPCEVGGEKSGEKDSPASCESRLSCKDKVSSYYMKMFEDQQVINLRLAELDNYLATGSKDSSILDISGPSEKSSNFNYRVFFTAAETLRVGLKYTPMGYFYYAGTAIYYGMAGKALADLIQQSFGLDTDVLDMIFSLDKPFKYALNRLRKTTTKEELKDVSILAVKDILPSIFYLSRKHM